MTKSSAGKPAHKVFPPRKRKPMSGKTLRAIRRPITKLGKR